MSSASYDRGPLMVDSWDSNWEADAAFDAHALSEPLADAQACSRTDAWAGSWADQGDSGSAEAHWGGVEAGEAWSQQIWDSAAWGAAALNEDIERPDVVAGPLWPVSQRVASGACGWRGPTLNGTRYDTFYRWDLVYSPALAVVKAPSPVLPLGDHVANGALWAAVPRSLPSRESDVVAVTPGDIEPRWPTGERAACQTDRSLLPRPRCFGRQYMAEAFVDIGATTAQVLTSISTASDVKLADALGLCGLTLRPRLFGPKPPEAVRRDELRATLRCRPRLDAARQTGALPIGALFDALATEREALETQDRLEALERSAIELADFQAAERARVACAGSSLLADVSFSEPELDVPSQPDVEEHSDLELLASPCSAKDEELLDPFARPLSGPRAGSLTESLLLQLKHDLRQQTRPRRRVASPAPSGRRAS